MMASTTLAVNTGRVTPLSDYRVDIDKPAQQIVAVVRLSAI
jgi:hypothetical protein